MFLLFLSTFWCLLCDGHLFDISLFICPIFWKKDLFFLWQPKKGRVLIYKYEKGRVPRKRQRGAPCLEADRCRELTHLFRSPGRAPCCPAFGRVEEPCRLVDHPCCETDPLADLGSNPSKQNRHSSGNSSQISQPLFVTDYSEIEMHKMCYDNILYKI